MRARELTKRWFSMKDLRRRMLPYELQVAELQKRARLEPDVRNAKRQAPKLARVQGARDAGCLVCGGVNAPVCEACQSVHYCSEEHQALDARWHDAVCEELRALREDEAVRDARPLREFMREWLARAPNTRDRQELEGWSAYLGTTDSAHPAERRVLTDLASRPLTVARLLEDLGVSRGAPVRIHVMAANARELESLDLYAELRVFWPESEFEIALIGPELPRVPIAPIAPAPGVRLSLHTGEYRRRIWSELGQPQLIVGFDAGLLFYPAWGRTLIELFGSGVPFAITSYRSWEARAEAEVLGRLGARCVRPPQPNPFASRASRRSSTVANDVSQDNSFVSVWR